MPHWILIADASTARIVTTSDDDRSLTLVRDFKNPDGRRRTSDLVSDDAGRISKTRTAGSRSAMDPRTDAHEVAADQFVHELATVLKSELTHGSFTSLYIVAPAHFLGLLRSAIGHAVQRHLKASHAADLVHVPTGELRSHLDAMLNITQLS